MLPLVHVVEMVQATEPSQQCRPGHAAASQPIQLLIEDGRDGLPEGLFEDVHLRFLVFNALLTDFFEAPFRIRDSC